MAKMGSWRKHEVRSHTQDIVLSELLSHPSATTTTFRALLIGLNINSVLAVGTGQYEIENVRACVCERERERERRLV